MPNKDEGDDKKSTKDVVNKKQKQMLNQEDYLPEEGYDVARDEGKVKSSKDKKDATTLPVSDEVKKTQKKSKGKSAFEIVKAKYGKAVMDTKKEELDLTKVAEAFGGYIVEETQEEKKKREDANNPKITSDVIKTTQKPEKVTKKMAKNIAKQDIEKTGEKFVGGSKSGTRPKKNIKFGEAPGAGPVKTYNIKDIKPTSKPVVKKSVTKQASDAAADALKDIQKDTEVMGKTMPDLKQDVKSTIPKPTSKPKRARRYKLSPEKQAERLAKVKAKIDAKNPTMIGKSGKPIPVPQEEPGMKGFKGFRKRTQRSVVKTGKQVQKAVAPVATPVAKFAKASPLGATIAGIEVAKITPGLKRFFTVKPPLPPKVKGGKVGRRTAG